MARCVLVVGLGRTGSAVARVLAARGDRVTVVERRTAGALGGLDLLDLPEHELAERARAAHEALFEKSLPPLTRRDA